MTKNTDYIATDDMETWDSYGFYSYVQPQSTPAHGNPRS